MTSRLDHLACARCDLRFDAAGLHTRCPCGGTLLARYDFVGLTRGDLGAPSEGLWRYHPMLPLSGAPVSLGEVRTPLMPLPTMSERWGVEAYLKDDGLLPTGTFKARGAAVGVSRAKELGAETLVMPSAGNAGGAWAFYAARAGIPITVTMARSAPLNNQREVTLAGGRLELVDGTIADAGRRAAAISGETGAFLAATFGEPYRVEGKKTAWLEVFDQLGDGNGMRFPGTIVLPVGGGVAAAAAAKAAEEVSTIGWTEDDPARLVGVQSEDCAPITRAFEAGDLAPEPWAKGPATIAAGLRVPAPSEGDLVLDRVRASGGSMLAVSDEDVRGAVRELASAEGIFVCPEGATTVVAATVLAARGELASPVVLYNTGTGLKYLDVLDRDPL
ncbi:MAG: threonine synthase [Actinomycetota bacterium]